MAKKDAFYFPHDSNAKDDPKCIMLIDQLGPEGYGIYWILVEVLRDQPEYKCPVCLIPPLAKKYNTTAEKMRTVINGYGLFVVENDEFFFSNSLIRRMEPLQAKKEQARLAGLKSAEKRALTATKRKTDERSFNDRSTTVQHKREEKKREEEIREEKKIEGEKIKKTAGKSQGDSLSAREKKFIDSLSGFIPQYGKSTIDEFARYWTEPNKSKTKMRFEMEKTWEVGRRLTTWSAKQSKFGGVQIEQKPIKATFNY